MVTSRPASHSTSSMDKNQKTSDEEVPKKWRDRTRKQAYQRGLQSAAVRMVVATTGHSSTVGGMRRQTMESGHQPSIYGAPSPPSIQTGGGGRAGWSKYGTLSGGSALSKSMKYAESWLYGSLALRSPDWQSAASLFGTVRGAPSAVRARPRLNLDDPYDMVRRSRLGRARSTSPPRNSSNSRKSILEQTISPYELMERVPAKINIAGQTIKMQESPTTEHEWSSSETLVQPSNQTPTPPQHLNPNRPPRKKPDKPEIKSILKKPQEVKKKHQTEKKSSFRDFKHKKKKQVQFRDTDTKKRSHPQQSPAKETRRLESQRPEIMRTFERIDYNNSDESEESDSGYQRSSLSERLGFSSGSEANGSVGGDNTGGPRINDTIRLRERSLQRRDVRAAFSRERGQSPGRPRPKEPPPPPPPPSNPDPRPNPKPNLHELRSNVGPDSQNSRTPQSENRLNGSTSIFKELRPNSESNTNIRPSGGPNTTRPTPNTPVRRAPSPPRPPIADTKMSSRNMPPPPPPPPRQIFPFTKEQIDKLNHNRPPEFIPTKILTLEETEDEPNYQNCREITKDERNKRAVTPPQLLGETCIHVNGIKLNVSPPDDPIPEDNTANNKTIVSVVDSSPPVNKDLTTSIKINDSQNLSKATSIAFNENQNLSKTTSIAFNENQNPTKTTSVVIGEPFVNKVTININGNENSVILEPITSKITVGEPTRIIVEQVKTKGEIKMDELVKKQLDPVEAARNNLIPHICGRKDSATSFEETTSDVEKTCSEMSSDMSSDSYKSALDFQISCSDENDVEKPNNNTLCPFSEKDKVEDEIEVRFGEGDFEEENHYETIRDPIYEELPDQPPPLPLSPPPPLIELGEEHIPTKSIFEGATKYDIISYLVGAKRRGIVGETTLVEEIESTGDSMSPSHSRISSLDLSSQLSNLSNGSDSSEDSCPLILAPSDASSLLNEKVRKGSTEIERNDSGVGSETSRSRWQSLSREDQQHLCEDCDQPVETQITQSGVMFAPLVCRKCGKRRAERREIITEIVETEEKYGRDLRILLEEFARPMRVAGLLAPDQLSAIFLNAEELLEHSSLLAERLRDGLEIALDQGDEDLLTVNVGAIFLEASPMLHAFQSYCTRQGSASLLLANLEKEKELLRIFLRVSQMENSVLRRMNLNSFLMVPVQRVTKYPLLLSRLYKVTPAHVVGKEAIREAQHSIELHLEHINYLAKDISTNKLWRRISITNGRRGNDEADMINIKLRKIAVDVLEWSPDEVRFAVEGKLLYTQPTDSNWKKRGTVKLTPINALLVTLGKPTDDYQPETEDPLVFPRNNGIRVSTLVLMKEKGGRYSLLREPLFLDRCIICTEAEVDDYFEVQELPSKDSYIFKAEDAEMTRRWYKQLQYHAQGAGTWRQRRNALANIMINGMTNRGA